MESAFNDQTTFFEIHDQREDRRRRPTVEERAPPARREPGDVGILRDEDQRDVCVSSLRLQLSQLMFFELVVPKIAPNKFKDRR